MKTEEILNLIDSMNDVDLINLHYLVESKINSRITKRCAKGFMTYNESKKFIKENLNLDSYGLTKPYTEEKQKAVYKSWWNENKRLFEMVGLPENPEEVYGKKV
jgi:hypothetical protein